MPHDLYHLPTYVQLTARQDSGRPLAFLAEEGDNLFFVPLIVRPIAASGRADRNLFDAITPYGYSTPLVRSRANGPPDAGFLARAIDSLARGLAEQGVVSVFFRLHPTLAVPLSSLESRGCVVEHGETVLLDLSLSDAELWRQTRSGHRNEINRARKRGYEVLMDEAFGELAAFEEIYAQTMRRVGADAFYFFSRDYFEEIKRNLRDVLHLCVVRIGQSVACAGLFSEVCGIVQYHLSGTRDEFVREYPTKIMLDCVRHWAKDRGNRVFHLGGGLGSGQDSLFAFKAGFSDLRAPFRTWRLVTDEEAYARLTRQWEAAAKTPADSYAGFFPAYRKPIHAEVARHEQRMCA
ncbi:MAG: GNAT family N-acetyltransferase [Pirellulales bacterium]